MATPRINNKLTPKENKYVKAISEGKSKRQAVREAYDVKPDVAIKTLDNMASKIEKRQQVLAVLEKQSKRAQELLTEVMEYTTVMGKSGTKEGAQYAGVAERALNSVLDRVHGKATQQIQVQSTSVNLNVDLTMSDTIQ